MLLESQSNPASQGGEVFPSTQVTWLGRALQDGDDGLRAAGEHVMRVYAHPLRVYLLGCSFRTLGEPDELVQGFFASRLSRQTYLHDWLRSGRPLRRWLIVGFLHYLHETARREKRWRAKVDGGRQATPNGAEEAFHREAALAIVREAVRVAAERCEAAGQEEHWRIFVKHHLEGLAYDALPEEIAAAPRRASVMARTAASKLKAAMRELIAWPGASTDQIDAEIRALMEEIQR